jgi:metallo-beta-lactamase family protein
MNHFSAHADQDDLVSFIKGFSPRPVNIFLVHGEQAQREALLENLKKEGITRVALPRFGDQFNLD